MADESDWRYQGQDRYLRALTFTRRPYRPAPGNDHDHCEFCSGKFMADPTDADFTKGWHSTEGDRWVCKTCFEDFEGAVGLRRNDDDVA